MHGGLEFIFCGLGVAGRGGPGASSGIPNQARARSVI